MADPTSTKESMDQEVLAAERAARTATSRWRWPVLLFALLLLLADQWTKYAAIEHLASYAHPMVVAADGTRTVAQLYADRGVTATELRVAIEARHLWSYTKTQDLTAASSLVGPHAPRQLIATTGTGFPPPRRLRVTVGDTKDSLGALIEKRWRVATPDVDGLLTTATYRANDLVNAPSLVPDAGLKIALLSREINVIDGFMKFVYAENPGAAWGVMRDVDAGIRVAFFSLISLLASLGMIWAIWTGWIGTTYSTWALGGVLSGALGNLIDRNLHSIVVDFILNSVGTHNWPVYNVADIGISVGVVVIMIELFASRPSPSRPSPIAQSPIAQSPIAQSPIAQSPIAQSRISAHHLRRTCIPPSI